MIIFLTLIYCAAMCTAAMAIGVSMTRAVLPSMAGLATLVIGSYVFGAVWDDKGRR